MNVLVIACNGVHLGFLGPYGNGWIETPNVDRLASEGVVFDHHYAENLTTLPTRRSWWTGRYGFPNPELGWTALRPDERILPDVLCDQGIDTALISDVPFLREVGQGFGRGFDEVIWIRGSGYDPYVPANHPGARDVRVDDEPGLRLPAEDDAAIETWKRRWGNYLRNRAALGMDHAENSGLARSIRGAVDWLERRRAGSRPFLLWLDLFSPHGPWDPPPPFRDMYIDNDPDDFEAGEEGGTDADEDAAEGEVDLRAVTRLIDVPAGVVGEIISEEELLRLRRTYASAVSFLDSRLGELLVALKRLGRADDTLVVFTADQGEPLGEHGYVRRFRPWLYEELIHTPLIVRLPGGECGGTRHRALVQTVDLYPTILSALGVPPDGGSHGDDLLLLARGRKTKFRDYACMGMDIAEFAIRTHHWHLAVPIEPDPDDPPRSAELYRKPEDRWDQNDVASLHPETAEALELTLRRFVEAIGRDEVAELPRLSDAARLGGE